MSSAAYGMTTKYGSSIGSGRGEGMGLFTISRKTFENLEQFIRDNEASAAKAQVGIDLLTRLMALTIKGFAQEKAAGPVAARHRSNPAFANRIPVQRISGKYFAGWTQRKMGHAHWMVYNDAKEAWLIEYGVFQVTRRPILKMSVIDMLRFIQTTRAGERFLDSILAPRRNAKGQFSSFDQRLGTGFKLGLTAQDMPDRGASNPNIVGPSGALP
jgi:hypothetical protein